MLSYALEGGKRLRGLLVLVTGISLNAKTEDLLRYSVAIELLQAASLIHDDLIDKSEIRRGKLSFWKKYETNNAILFPHILISKALSIISGAGIKILLDFIRAWEDITMGQMIDVEIMSGKSTFNNYLELIKLKTGVGFEVSSLLGAVIAKREDLVRETRNFGLSIGLAYQILDDLVDIKRGFPKNSGSAILLYKKLRGKYEYLLKKEIEKALNLASTLDIYKKRYLRKLVIQSINAMIKEGKLNIELEKIIKD